MAFEVKRIIVPTSFSKRSDAAIQRAVDLASRVNADILLIHIIEPSVVNTEITTPAPLTAELKSRATEKLKEIAAQILSVYGLQVRCKVYTDTLYSGIYRAATYFDADLIVMGHEHTRGLSAWLAGANAERISVYAHIPVLSVSSRDAGEIKVILFPFNEDIKTLEKLEQVKVLAKVYDAVIHIAAFRNSDKALTKSNIYLHTKKVAESVLKEGIWCSTHLLVGSDYSKEVLEFAGRLNADLISVAVYPIKSTRKVFSSTSFKKLVTRSNIPVLSIPVL